LNVRNIVDEFLIWSRQNNRAENTIKHYQGRLKHFVATYGDREFDSLKPLEISKCLYEAGIGKAPDTQRSNIVAIERLQSWALDVDLLEKPILKKKLEKPAPRLRERIPTPEETATILENAENDFRLLYSSLRQCGARPGELCGLQIDEVHFDQELILLKKHKTFRKTQKPREIVIGDKLAELLREGIGNRTEGHAFLRATGTPWTTNSASRTFSRLRDRAELPKDLCLYLLRHDHATQVCQKKGIHAAKDSLGHTNIKTTQRYLHTTDEELQDSQDLVE